ncbi:MAG: hypothetical protein ACREO0_02545 [Pseudoxanthomonas sp.]
MIIKTVGFPLLSLLVANASAQVDASLQTGYVTFQDKIYTVFLLAD